MPETGFRLADHTVRAPNLGFVRTARVDEVKSKGFARGAPDLAVEIFSTAIPSRSSCAK